MRTSFIFQFLFVLTAAVILVAPQSTSAFVVEETNVFTVPGGALYAIEFSIRFDDRVSHLPVFGTRNNLPDGQQPALSYTLHSGAKTAQTISSAAFILSDTPLKNAAYEAPAGEDVHYTLYVLAQLPSNTSVGETSMAVESLRLQTIANGTTFSHVMDSGPIESAKIGSTKIESARFIFQGK